LLVKVVVIAVVISACCWFGGMSPRGLGGCTLLTVHLSWTVAETQATHRRRAARKIMC
jgi:hypothetical protein